MNLANRLLKSGVLTPAQLGQALYRQKKFRGFLGKHLADLNLVAPGELAQYLPPYPPVPETFQEMGLPENLLAELFLKHAFYRYSFSVSEMSTALKIPRQLVRSLAEYLITQKFLDIKTRDVRSLSSDHLAVDTKYTLSDLGKRTAERVLEFCSYTGPAPVTLEDYWDWVEAQTIQQGEVKAERLREAFSDYVVPERLFEEMGSALASGRSIFLFGPSGNGKTALARCVGEIFDDPVFIPYALYVYGQIIRVYDEYNHQPSKKISTVLETSSDAVKCDARWVRCQRPVIIAGGEMTEAALEPKYNPISKYYEAPHQLQANNGILIIDDFGRQKISPRRLLNRWMVPLETRQDYCNLHTGQQFSIPFDQLIIFCTNLDPNTLADEAFLRRIRHKIFIGQISHEQYLEIFRRACVHYDIEFDLEVVQGMIDRHYVLESRPFRACHPRDLLENLIDRAKFHNTIPELTPTDLDIACQNYFVKNQAISDYDKID
jgi:hypothetical protein